MEALFIKEQYFWIACRNLLHTAPWGAVPTLRLNRSSTIHIAGVGDGGLGPPHRKAASPDRFGMLSSVIRIVCFDDSYRRSRRRRLEALFDDMSRRSGQWRLAPPLRYGVLREGRLARSLG